MFPGPRRRLRWSGTMLEQTDGPRSHFVEHRSLMRFGPFLLIAILLFVVWLGFILFHVASALIHLVLLIAVIALFLHFFTGPTRTA